MMHITLYLFYMNGVILKFILLLSILYLIYYEYALHIVANLSFNDVGVFLYSLMSRHKGLLGGSNSTTTSSINMLNT